MENLEYLIEPEAAIKEFYKSKNLLFLLLIMNMAFELLICYYFLLNEKEILSELDDIYKFWHFKERKEFYEGLTKCITAVNLIIYTYGLFAVCSLKVTNYQIFLMLLMISIFAGVLMTYLNM